VSQISKMQLRCPECGGTEGAHFVGCTEMFGGAEIECPSCDGINGHHTMGCAAMAEEVDVKTMRGPDFDDGKDAGEAMLGRADEEHETFDEQKLPPTDNDVQSNDLLWLVAKVCHEVNRVYCQSIGDWSQPEWDSAPDWQRESCHKGVTMHFENPEATPEDSHRSWLKEKVANDWTYGPVKDADNKIHPCLVPYNQLPPAHSDTRTSCSWLSVGRCSESSVRARVHQYRKFWWAWSFTTGWPRRTRLAYFDTNEYEPGVRHLGVVLLGYSTELRWCY